MTAATLTLAHRWQPASQPTLPTLLLLHGTGGNETSLLQLGPLLLPGAALLSPRGNVLERGMPRFFRRIAPGRFDLADLRVRTHELADFVAQASTVYGFDAGNVIAAGYSNGANIAASTLLLRPQTLHRAVLFHPMVPLVPAQLPDLSGRQIFIAAGRRDPMTPPEQAEQLAAMLREAGAAVTMHWQPGGHELTMEEIEAAHDWLHQ